MQQQQTTVATWCDRIIEGGWLLAVVLIPGYFNLLSARHFEPDKATTLRALVLVLLAAALVRWLEMAFNAPKQVPTQPAEGSALQRAWRRIMSTPLALPVLVYVGVFLLATVVSVAPATSFWGSYQRLQGTYTNLSYIALGALVVLHMRSREQLDRFVVVTILGSLVAVGYGLVQHFQFDPLPWRGDVVTRVASTMGNSIFVAAYMIMVLPFALYRAFAAFHAANQAPALPQRSRADLGWAVAYVLLVAGALAVAFAAIQFGAVVRVPDLRYWWVYPGALVVAYALFLVPTLRPHTAGRFPAVLLWPGIVLLIYIVLVGLFFLAGQASGVQVVRPHAGRGGTEWPIWMIGGTLLVVAAYALFLLLPSQQAPSSRLLQRLQGAGMTLIAGLLAITIFFTQSRGPWIGIGVGLVVFFSLVLWFAYQRDRAAGRARSALWRNLLVAEVMLAVVLGAFIVVFNFSDAPVFERLREVPYIGRMGKLLDTRPGTTGDVRLKIWFGDDKTRGAVGLITAEPLRTLVGWGPETMFVAYNRFYPPSLANVEARGASPDRSHQAYLDELVTKGLLGLISYLFVLVSFFALAWRLIRNSDEWAMQVFFIACLAVVVAHSVEGLTGIPIVATLMLLWLTIGVTVVGGELAGHYTLRPQAAAAPVVAAEAEAAGRRQPAGRAGRQRRGAAPGRAGAGRATLARRKSSNPAAMLAYALILIVALAAAWFINADSVYADMRFQQGEVITSSPSADLAQQLAGMSYYYDALRMEPHQDFYYLSMGRTLMTIVDIKRQSGVELGQIDPDASVEDLLSLPDSQAAQTFIASQSPLETLSYARAVLQRAHDLNPLNKDHSANLARLHSFWYTRLEQDPEVLRRAIEWYERSHEVAPQDVVILNELAGAVAMLGSYLERQGDVAAAQEQYDRAEMLLAESKATDPRFRDTDLRLADLARLRGDYAAATDRYIALLQSDPHALDSQVVTILDSFSGHPDQLRRLRDAYTAALEQYPEDATLLSIVGLLSARSGDLEQARAAFERQTELEPDNVEARRNYTIVLSDSRQYELALQEAQALLAMLQQQQRPQDVAELQALVEYLRTRTPGG